MALLDEQLVEEWLNRQKFFTMRGLKCGVDEIDLLALRHAPDGMECWHVEVQISYRPVGYIGGDTNARRRNTVELRAGVEQWVKKKFTTAKKVQRRNEVLPDARWRFILVHAALKDPMELSIMQELGIQVIPHRRVLAELCEDKNGKSSSAASSIVEMLNYLK